MDVEAAHINQIRQARDGRFHEISAEASTVVADLKRLDEGFGVRFAENGNPPYWHVYMHTVKGDQITDKLVLSVQARQNSLGVWEGLDQRTVREIMRMGHSSFNLADELEKGNAKIDKDKEDTHRERNREMGEILAHAIRKDLGGRYKGRIFT